MKQLKDLGSDEGTSSYQKCEAELCFHHSMQERETVMVQRCRNLDSLPRCLALVVYSVAVLYSEGPRTEKFAAGLNNGKGRRRR